MGMVVLDKNTSFVPQNYGISNNALLTVICIGGGASGRGVKANDAADLSKTGGNTSFGTYLTALGGSGGDHILKPGQSIEYENFVRPQSGCMGLGGLPAKYNTDIKSLVLNAPGGGAGGYLPGIPIYGGNGGCGVAVDYAADRDKNIFFSMGYVASGLAGYGGFRITIPEGDKIFMPESSISPYANVWGSGNKGAGGTSLNQSLSAFAAGGNGYGAGGAGAIRQIYGGSWRGGNGGNAGSYAQTSFIIANVTTAIPVTIGYGGVPDEGNAGVGANGVVVVLW